MKKNIKRIACVLGSIVGGLVIALVCLIIFLDPIIKGVIEGFGPKIAGVRFEVEDISTSIFRGRVAIKNLIMYNPEGYNSEYAAKLGDVVFHTEVMSWIFGKKAIIREVRLRDITLNYETELPISTQSNLSAILDNVKKAAGANAPAPAEESAVQEESPAPAAESVPQEPETPAAEETSANDAPAPAEKEGKRLQLDKLIIDNVRVVVVPKGLAEFQVPLIITLPEMGPVGEEGDGLLGTEIAFALASDIVSGVTSSVVSSADAVYKSLSQQGMKLADAVTGTVKELSEKSKDLVESFKKNDGAAIIKKSESLVKDIKEDKTLKKVGDGLKNIFK